MTDVTDLIGWLRSQLDEDEQAAPNVHALDCELTMTAGFSGPCTCGWTDRLLAEVDAKRKLLDLHGPGHKHTSDGTWCYECGTEPCRQRGTCGVCGTTDGCPTVRLLALPYADRPGYRQEWRP